jgi:hypothetical protein
VNARRTSRSCCCTPSGTSKRYGDTPISFSAAEKALARLLAEFGPPRKTSPAYPFHHLASDGLWTGQHGGWAGKSRG